MSGEGEETRVDVEAIRARVNAATEGPWQHQPYGGQNQNGDYAGGSVFDGHGEYLVSEVADRDGEFIAHARTDVSALLDEVEQLRAQRDGRGDVESHTLWHAERDRDRLRNEHGAQVTLRRKTEIQLETVQRELDAALGTIAAAHALADRWEHGALRWADPLPVPPEVKALRDVLDGAA